MRPRIKQPARRAYPTFWTRSKVRKAPDGKSYEYYCTSQTSNATGAVNLALIFVEADGDWRIGEFELKQDN